MRKIVVVFLLLLGAVFSSNVQTIKIGIEKAYTDVYPSLEVENVSFFARSDLDIDRIKILNIAVESTKSYSGSVTLTYSYDGKEYKESIKYILEAKLIGYVANENINSKTNFSPSMIKEVIYSLGSTTVVFPRKDEILDSSSRTFIPVNSPITRQKLAKRIVIFKGDEINLQLSENGVLVTVVGVALENGGLGDRIRVQNKDTKKSLYGVVIDHQNIRIR